MSSAYFSTVTATDFLNAGRSVTGFDINGDGLGDLIIGADLAVSSEDEETGRVVVLFGSTAEGAFASSTISLEDDFQLDGSDGFVISGDTPSGEFGWDVLNAGDQNGDTRDDLAIVSRLDGTVTVIFGRPTSNFPSDLDIGSGLAATDGYTVSGLGFAADHVTVSGGTNVGGTGTSDLIIGVSGGGGTDTVHIVLDSGADFDIGDFDGSNGYSITGVELVNTGDGTTDGFNIGTLGDVDGDGTDDILLGRLGPDEFQNPSGDFVILRGGVPQTQGSIDVDSLDAEDRILLTGLDASVASTASITGNLDLNSDGDKDIVIGVPSDDTDANNAGLVYVVFGGSGIASSVDLTDLGATEGFAISGLGAGAGLGLVVESLGDVTGDDIDDLGILTKSGDLYVVYGIESTETFPADLDLNTLDGTNGFKITGLFDDTPESLSLSAVSINGNNENDIAIGATFVGGTEGETVVILGGIQNLSNLDAADDNGADGEINLDQVGELDFAETEGTLLITGDKTADLTENETEVTGAIGISDSNSGNPTPTFANREGTGGFFGGLVVGPNGLEWTYTITDDVAKLAQLQGLSEGQSEFDTIEVTAVEEGTNNVVATQTITIEITGVDDPAIFTVGVVSVSEDVSQTTFAYSLTDADADDNPSLANLRFDGAAGYVQFNADGDAFTVFTTDPTLQDLTGAQTRDETITVTDSAGNSFDIDLTFSGADEGTPLNFDNDPNDIFTSFGDDIINALGGADNINPGAGDDTVNAGDGNDEVRDGLGDDTVNGEGNNDLIILLSGENTVDGGAGNDFIRTGYNSDTIDGGADDDVISADSGAVFFFGNDTVTGGTGNDIMKAGAGADTFVFRPNDGDDIIAEFNEAAVDTALNGFAIGPSGAEFESGIDKISLVGFSSVNAGNLFDPMETFMTDAPDGAVFSAEGTEITFWNVSLASLSIDDFIFS